MKVRKAVIPAAGLGTRMLPVTKTVPKEMLPMVDRPVLQYVVEEAVEAGIEDILIITNRGKDVMAMDRDNGRGPRIRKRRKVCQFCADKCESIDYKDAAKLRRFVSERSKILPRRTTGTCAMEQVVVLVYIIINDLTFAAQRFHRPLCGIRLQKRAVMMDVVKGDKSCFQGEAASFLRSEIDSHFRSISASGSRGISRSSSATQSCTLTISNSVFVRRITTFTRPELITNRRHMYGV